MNGIWTMSEQQDKPEVRADTLYDETSLAERVLQRMARTNRWMICSPSL